MMNRRDFVRDAMIVPGVATVLFGSSAGTGISAGQSLATAPAGAVQLAEWNALWIGIERVEVYRGTVISGKQMYVEYQVPRQRRHPYPLVLVHGNGGQGFDWMTTPDGRSGWVTHLLQDGYAVYLVDLPGLGRVPYSVELHGPYGQAPTYEQIQRALGAAGATPGTSPASARLHTQWPADGTRAPADESSERARSAREWRVRRPGTDSGRGRVSQAGGMPCRAATAPGSRPSRQRCDGDARNQPS